MSARLEHAFVVTDEYTERLVVFDDIAELRSEHGQALLALQHGRNPAPYCGCGLARGERHRLVVQRFPSGLYCLLRQHAAEHSARCWLTLSRDSEDLYDRFSAAIFQTSRPRHTVRSAIGYPAPPGLVRRKLYRFGRFVTRTLAEAQVEVFAAKNPIWRTAGFAQPTAADFFGAFDRQLRQPGFASGSAYAAAGRSGATLRFGLVRGDARPISARGAIIGADWWSGGRLCHETIFVLADVWHAALGELKAFGHIQRGPYFVVALLESDGAARVVKLYACACPGPHLTLCESRYEANFAAQLLAEGRAFIKPLLAGDCGALLSRLGVEAQPPTGFYRPDFFVPRVEGRNFSAEIIELRGPKPGAMPVYDAHLAEKADFYGRADSATWHYQEYPGWEYDHHLLQPGYVACPLVPTGWWGITLAAHNWVVTCAQRRDSGHRPETEQFLPMNPIPDSSPLQI